MKPRHRYTSITKISAACLIILTGLCISLPAAKKKKEDKEKEGLTTEDFFRSDETYNFNLSRDGKKVSYVMRKGDKTYVMIYDLKTQKYSSMQIDDDPDTYVSYLEWANDKRYIFSKNNKSFYAIDANGKNVKVLAKYEMLFEETVTIGERRGVSAALAGDSGGSTIRPYRIRIPGVLDMLKSDPDHVLFEVYDETFTSNIYKVDVNSGKRNLVYDDLRGVSHWITDRNGELRAGLEYQNLEMKLRYRYPDSNKWKIVDKFLSEESGVSFEYDADALTNRHCTLLGFGFDPNIVYIGSNLKKDTMGIYTFDLDRQEIVSTLAEHSDFDLAATDSEHSLGVLRFSNKKRALVGFNTYFHTQKTEWIDPDFQVVQATVDNVLPDKDNYIYEWNDDETVFLVYSRDSNDPGRYHVLDLNNKKFYEVAAVRPWLEPARLVKKLPYMIESKDGYKLYGYVTFPKSTETQPLPWNLPLVVMPHGGPWARDYGNFDESIQCLAHNGYAVLQVNYRGSTGYGFKHFEGARHDYGAGILNDILAVIDWAVESGIADPQRVGIMGTSYGGYATMMALTRHPDRFQCGVAISGVYDLKDQMTSYVAGGRGNYMAYDYWKSMVGDPKKERDKLEAISPINFVDNLDDPVLIIHGDEDETVPFSQSKALEKALKKADKAYHFITITNGGHHRWSDEVETKVHESILELFNSRLM